MYPVPTAFEAAQRGDMDECNRIVVEKIQELDPQYDQIVLAQISMSGAATRSEPKHAKLFTSPSEALQEMLEKLKA